MTVHCENCGKLLKNPDLTHCSDQCLFDLIKNSKSLNESEFDASFWFDSTDPWN